MWFDVMNQTVIRIENLGKKYRIGAPQIKYKTMRESLTEVITGPFRRIRHRQQRSVIPETIWALKHISFDVKQGEVMGIIGNNGAGKSTLLKILSHITEPTEGKVRLRGRVGSLLEVGTGFHAELSGRENVYLNGAILGMKKSEIDRKFDEIVAFAEIEKFVDTAVKHYSSGMYLRLAFAVAAHLESEILLVDEILAVGDIAFQKKCLGKMGEVAHQGRTVLFVSHSMASIKILCTSALLLRNGNVNYIGSTEVAVNKYLSSSGNTALVQEWNETSAFGDDYFRLLKFEILQDGSTASENISTGKPLEVKVKFSVNIPSPLLQVGFELETADGILLFQSFHTDEGEIKILDKGIHCFVCKIPSGTLNAGGYVIRPLAALYFTRWLLDRNLPTDLRFQVTFDHSNSPLWTIARAGATAPCLFWNEIQKK